MSTFENPLNGYRESVTFVGAFVLTLLCGPFYFLYRNVWNHAAISFAIILLAAILPVMILGAAGAVLAALMLVVEWLAYAFFSYAVIRVSYLQRGWKQVERV